MKTVRFANAAKSKVIVVEGTQVRHIPTEASHPVWQALLAEVVAGQLTIADYEPPQPQAQD